MVLVPAGCFMMGYNVGIVNDEQPVHQQCFDTPFWIDRTEVTRAQYNQCVAAGVCTAPASNTYSTRDEQPVNSVTWFEALDYCAWLDTRLPSEREWEYAARGPDNLVYPWGNDFVTSYVASADNSNETADVGSRPNGASWVGALDMSGNVEEWVSSLYRDYEYNAMDGREDMQNTTSARVLRGGSIQGAADHFFRAADRLREGPSVTFNIFGFRCARDYEPPQ
jgi:formylglycine-generating enzyme required for sulfatase activity